MKNWKKQFVKDCENSKFGQECDCTAIVEVLSQVEADAYDRGNEQGYEEGIHVGYNRWQEEKE